MNEWLVIFKYIIVVLQIQMSALAEVRKRIKEILKEEDKSEVDLSDVKIGRFTDDIRKEIEKCTEATVLILTECDLSSLENMPRLPTVIAIDLSSNK